MTNPLATETPESELANEIPVGDASVEIATIATMPEARSVFLGGLFFMAFFACLKIAGSILLPIVIAFIFKMVLEPFMRLLAKLRLGRTAASLVAIIIVIGCVLGIIVLLSSPATHWASKLPNDFPGLREKLNFVRKPFENIHDTIQHAEVLTTVTTPDAKPVTVAVQGNTLSDKLISNTQNFFSGIFETILVLFFLLSAGDTFLRRLVEILPRFKDKRQAVDISQQTEQDISAYLATITFMNAIVGISTTIIMKICGIEDALLWGAVAFLLNYIPIIGPIICITLFLIVGFMSRDTLGAAMLPAALYVFVHLIESMYITPLLVARRFVLNPVIVIVSLIFWYWMWGVAGAIISTPLLAIAKIICDRIESLKALGHFLEGERRLLNII